jgi:hypothetical protein
MQNPLSERCFNIVKEEQLSSDFKKILRSLLVEKEFLQEEVESFLLSFIAKPKEAHQDLTSDLKEFLSLLFLLTFGKRMTVDLKNQVVATYHLLRKHPDAFDDSLINSYLALIAVLIDQEIQDFEITTLPSGFVLRGNKEISPYGDQVVLHQQIEIALNLLLIALIKQDYHFASTAGKMISAFANCLNEEQELVVGLWSESILKEKGSFFSVLFLTLYAFNQVAQHPLLDQALSIQSEVINHFSNQEIQGMGSYPIVLSLFIDQVLNRNLHELRHDIAFFPQSEKLFQDVGLVVDRLGNYSTYLTLSGINHSVGSILSKDVHVIAMGPHFFPLGDLSKFGIYHLVDKEHFIPISVEKNESSTLIKGMTKLISSDSSRQEAKPSDTWLEVEINNKMDKLQLSVSLIGEPVSKPLSFAFFIKSKETEMIGNHVIKPRTLDKYVGPAQKVVFKGHKKNLTILPCFDEKMHLIPLQGKNYFWGADYLLACEISQFQKKYSWEFL